MVTVMPGTIEDITYAYTVTAAVEAAAIHAARFPDCEVRISKTSIPNETGCFDTGFVIYPFGDDVPY